MAVMLGPPWSEASCHSSAVLSQGNMKKGDRILQLSFGSGFKCAAGYWRALRDVKDARHAEWDPACKATLAPEKLQPNAKKP